MAAEHLLDFHFPLRHVLLSGTASGKEGTASDRLRIIITLATAFVMPDAIVIMGILSFFGLATLITALLNPLLSRIPAFAGLPVSFLLFLLTKEAPTAIWGLKASAFWSFPVFYIMEKS